MSRVYLLPCSPLCGTVYYAPGCRHFSAAHDPASGEPFALIPAFDSVPPDSPFAAGADDDPDAPGRCRDAADDGCLLCFPFKVACECERGPFDYGNQVPAEHGSPADEYDMRPPRDGADFGEDD